MSTRDPRVDACILRSAPFARPILRRFGLSGTARASCAFYNTLFEVETLAAALRRLAESRRSTN